VPETITWDLVLKRNSIERLKRERAPITILDHLPRLIDEGYERMTEEDIVRLQWYGLYHDKPKTGHFMMRVKLPRGVLTPAKLRAIGQISLTYGENSGELSTRQNVQLHHIELEELPAVFADLKSAGLTTAGGCGDCVRNITGCPVAGVDPDELFDCTGLIDEVAAFFFGNPDYSDLPRKHKITISTCAHQCNASAINCIALTGMRHEGRNGYAVKVGGGLSATPRLARDLGIFVEPHDALPVLRAILDAWKEDPKYRMSRVKARLKFMVDDYGPDRFRDLIEQRLGRQLEHVPGPSPAPLSEHIGVHPQKQEGLSYIGFPAFLGMMNGEQMVRLADLVEGFGGDVRVTRQQNFVVAGVPNARVQEVIDGVRAIGYDLNVNKIRASSIACTGEPLCNYSVAETKSKLSSIITHLEDRFDRQVEGINVQLDGCPHACAHHWTGDIGLQGTTARETGGQKLEAYDIYLRGGLGDNPVIGRPILRRVLSEQTEVVVEKLVAGYLAGRQGSESFQQFTQRHDDEALTVMAGMTYVPPKVHLPKGGAAVAELVEA